MGKFRFRWAHVSGRAQHLVAFLGEHIHKAQAYLGIGVDVYGGGGRCDVGNDDVFVVHQGKHFFGRHVGLALGIGSRQPAQHAALGHGFVFGGECGLHGFQCKHATHGQ